MDTKSNILKLLYNKFETKVHDYSIVFSIIYTLYQLIPWEDTRKIIIEMEDMIKLVIKCLKCKNSGIIFVSLNFLEIVRLFEPKWNERIKTKKFKIQNQVYFYNIRDSLILSKHLRKSIEIRC
jgi:hypothetical protein